MLCIAPPLPPGCRQTVWGDDERFVKTYFSAVPGQLLYSTFDYATRDEDGYYFILGRTDDVINVAGHRLGTREIEEAIQAHANVAEVAVVGVADSLKGQMPLAFAVLKNTSVCDSPEGRANEEKVIMATVDKELGAIARPSRVHFVSLLPKTRSGKLLRRAMQAMAEGRDPGDMTTLEDPAALEQIRAALARQYFQQLGLTADRSPRPRHREFFFLKGELSPWQHAPFSIAAHPPLVRVFQPLSLALALGLHLWGSLASWLLNRCSASANGWASR